MPRDAVGEGWEGDVQIERDVKFSQAHGSLDSAVLVDWAHRAPFGYFLSFLFPTVGAASADSNIQATARAYKTAPKHVIRENVVLRSDKNETLVHHVLGLT